MVDYLNWLNGFDFSMMGSPSINKLMTFSLCLTLFSCFLIFLLYKLVSYYSVKSENDNNFNINNSNLFYLSSVLLFLCTCIIFYTPFRVSSMTGGEFVEVVDEYILDFDNSIKLEVHPSDYDSEYILNGESIGLKWNDSVNFVYDSDFNRFESKIMENSYGYKKEFITIYYAK